jgi:6-phosphogluconolactonase
MADAAPQLLVVKDIDTLSREASRIVLSWLADSLGRGGRARVFLSGGSTPKRTYSLLASAISRQGLPAHQMHWYFGDERWVPPTDPQSNERMARETILGPIEAPESTIHSWLPGTGDPVDCAGRYGERLRAELDGSGPDILLLGVGADGHTASLFPGATACLPDGQQVQVGPGMPADFFAAAIRGGGAPAGWRLTLCPDFLRRARQVLFLASGADKAGPVRRAMAGDAETPAGWIRGMTTHYIVTRDADPGREKH